MRQIEMERLLRPADVVRMLAVTVERVHQLIETGELAAVRVGGFVRMPQSAWVAWLADRCGRAVGAVRGDQGQGCPS